MLYRACARLASLAPRNDSYLLQASVHSSVRQLQLVKKNTEATSTPTKGKSPNASSESYPSGEAFFSHNEYSFYDAEIDMAKDRLKQISSKVEEKPAGK